MNIQFMRKLLPESFYYYLVYASLKRFLFLAIFVFPITNLIREQVTAEAKVITKNNGICVVETPDHPRGIPNCIYNIGDTLIVSYAQGTEAVSEHRIKR